MPGGALDAAALASAPAPAGIPCPPNGQLKQGNGWKSGANASKILQLEIDGAARRFGTDHVGMLTLSFPDEVHDMVEASRRLNSLFTGALRERFVQFVTVLQRHKRHGLHAHTAVVVDWDIRGNLSWEALKRRQYGSAPRRLRDEWAFLRDLLPRYGFGRHELLPMRGHSEGLGRYLARYLSRELGTRRKGDRGARLVRYSQSWERVVVGPFTWNDRRTQRARERAVELAIRLWGSWGKMLRDVGPNWKYHLLRTLYCGPEYDGIVTTAEHDLEFYAGVQFALDEAWKAHDRRRADSERDYPWLACGRSSHI
jgi:hypothetical protein